MKRTILSLLRDKKTTAPAFRRAADQLGTFLAFKVAEMLEVVELSIETPVAKTKGYQLKHNIVLIPILRAGIAMLNPFMQVFPSSKVGFVGIKRDEKTALPHLYYENIPEIQAQDVVIILDPMIATGGSGGVVIDLLKDRKISMNHVIYTGMVAAPEGIELLQKLAPEMRVVAAEIDDRLNDKKFIMPGLGDFGDRYFGTT